MSFVGRWSAGAALAVMAMAGEVRADCELVWNTGWTNNTLGGSYSYSGTYDREVADDFEYTGDVVRLFVEGTGPLPTIPTPIHGVWVRFYAWTANGPGALQRAEWLPAGDPNLGVLDVPNTIDVKLATPFAANGRHFVSVQIDYPAGSGYWEPWIGSSSTPQLSRAWVRDNFAGGAWGPHTDIFGAVVDRDMSFEVWADNGVSACLDLEEMPTPAPSLEYTILRDIDMRTATDGWAVGHYSAVVGSSSESRAFGMHFDGVNWIQTPMPSPAPYPGGANVQLWAVDALSANDVWAGGTQRMQVNGGWVNQQVLVEHWDGSAWSVVPSPLPPTSIGAGYGGAHVYDIEAISTNEVWFVGRWVGPYPGTSSTTPALTMMWDGTDFQLTPNPVIGSSMSLNSLSAISSNDIWAVGTLSSAQTQYPYVVRWNGSAWSHVIIPPAGVIQGVADVVALAPNDVWIAAHKFTLSNPAPVLLHFNGTSWTQSTPPIAASSMFATSSNDLYLAGASIHHFDGTSWSELTGPACMPWPSYSDIDGAGGDVFAAGRQLGAGLTPAIVRTTQNGCSAYTYCTSSITINSCVAAISWQGTPSASASSGFTLRVDNLEGQRQGLVFYSVTGQQALPWTSGSTSFLCVKLPTQRMGAQSTGGTIGACNGALVQDWNAFMAATPAALGQPRFAGQVFDAQGWFRDPPSPKTTNLSNALHFVLAP